MRCSLSKEQLEIYKGTIVAAGLVCTSIIYSYVSQVLDHTLARLSQSLPTESLSFFTPTLVSGVVMASQIFIQTPESHLSPVGRFSEKTVKGMMVYVPTVVIFGLIDQLIHKFFSDADPTLSKVVKHTAGVVIGGSLGTLIMDSTDNLVHTVFALVDVAIKLPLALSIVVFTQLLTPVTAESATTEVKKCEDQVAPIYDNTETGDIDVDLSALLLDNTTTLFIH